MLPIYYPRFIPARVWSSNHQGTRTLLLPRGRAAVIYYNGHWNLSGYFLNDLNQETMSQRNERDSMWVPGKCLPKRGLSSMELMTGFEPAFQPWEGCYLTASRHKQNEFGHTRTHTQSMIVWYVLFLWLINLLTVMSEFHPRVCDRNLVGIRESSIV